MGHWFHREGTGDDMFTKVSEISNGKEWPDGVVEKTYIVGGPLARRIQLAAHRPSDVDVILTVREEDGGYSEWTQETDYQFTVRVGDMVADFTPYNPHNMVDAFDKWLNENAGEEINVY